MARGLFSKTLLVLFVTGVLLYFLSSQFESGLPVGEPAPAWLLRDRSGQDYSLASLQGRPVLINFWATWCPTCVGEIPSLNRLQKKIGSQVVLVGISVDEAGWRAIDSFRQKIPINFIVLLDPAGRVADLYHVHRLPESYLIGSDGKVLKRFSGPREWDSPKITSLLLRFLGKATLPAGD